MAETSCDQFVVRRGGVHEDTVGECTIPGPAALDGGFRLQPMQGERGHVMEDVG